MFDWDVDPLLLVEAEWSCRLREGLGAMSVPGDRIGRANDRTERKKEG